MRRLLKQSSIAKPLQRDMYCRYRNTWCLITTFLVPFVIWSPKFDSNNSNNTKFRITKYKTRYIICCASSIRKVYIPIYYRLMLGLRLDCRYMKFLYPYECEKYGFSTPAELHSAIDGNRREGRRPGFPYDTNPGNSLIFSHKIPYCPNLKSVNGVSVHCMYS